MVEKRQLVYLYCIANKEPKINGLGNDLYSICNNGLYAVASKVNKEEFGQEGLKRNMADFEWIKTRASLHEKIIERVMDNINVIPFKFATLFNTDDSLSLNN